MALGCRERERQTDLWVPTADLPRGPGHPFYKNLNELLAAARFDEFVEELCRPHYAARLGRPGIPPEVYFRMLLVGYFEGLDRQRDIAWRCADSLALNRFLGYQLTAATPEHSSLTTVRQRLPDDVHGRVFAFVLSLAERKQLLKGKTVGVDATLLEANAAMKSIVRKDTGAKPALKMKDPATDRAEVRTAGFPAAKRLSRGSEGWKVAHEFCGGGRF